jgi:hypothetical protein
VAINPNPYVFATRNVGTIGSNVAFTLKNNTAASVNILSASTSSPEFYLASTTCTATLGPGASCVYYLSFRPTVGGLRSGSLTVQHSGPFSPAMTSLSGTATNPVTVSATSLAFSTYAVGTTSPAKNVTVTNKQSVPVNITGISISGNYAQTNNCPGSLAAGGTCTVSVTFTPAAVGANPGSLSITHSSNNSPVTVTLSGNGS